jgi:dolichyl-phosphate beta-glucosyltransferase
MVELSIIMPVFNESLKIAQDIFAADHFLTSRKFPGEIIIVDDGSVDNTVEIAKQTSEKIASTCIVKQLGQNRSKGFAVRSGILQSKGNFVVFADSGCCVPFHAIESALDLIRSGQCHIAHGSRKMVGTKILQPQSVYRKICSRKLSSQMRQFLFKITL